MKMKNYRRFPSKLATDGMPNLNRNNKCSEAFEGFYNCREEILQ